MKLGWIATLICVLGITAIAKDKPDVPDAMRNGNFVYITTSYGDGDGENLSPTAEDRNAAAATETELRQWLRYKSVKSAKQADIILVARTGKRRGSPSVTIGNDPRHQGPGGLPPINGPFPGSGSPIPKSTNDSSADDYLLVFDANALDNAPPIWQKHMRNGFGSDMALFRAFKRDVESAKP
jgi:hypothetical protein